MPTRNPLGDTLWPPKPFNDPQNAMRVWNAWYTGDQTALQSLYASADAGARTRPSQYAGGVVGAAARFWWGKPQPLGQARSRIHVPLPADIATISADLLFSEPPRVVVGGDQDAAAHRVEQDRIEALLNTPRNYSALLEAAEVQAALGGCYLSLTWDRDIADHPILVPQDGDCAVPEFRFGDLTAVTFWTDLEVDESGVTYRHLERHTPGFIEHSLWRSSAPDRLGTQIPVTEHPATAWAADAAATGGATLDGLTVTIPTGITRLTAAYVPNIRPSLWRGRDQIGELGRPDYHQIEPWFDAIDETYAAWLRDIRLAKARLIVPEAMLTNLGAGRGASFDDEQELFTGIDAIGKPGDLNITPSQFAIRWAEHQQSCREFTDVALRTAGYSTASLTGDVAAAAATATEVTDRNRMSQRTRDKKAEYWKPALASITAAMLDLDVAVFGAGAGRTPSSGLPEVRFQAEVQIDPEKVARTAQSLRVAEAASTETLVRMVHPEWDGDTVNKEVARIDARAGSNVPDPFSITT